MTRPAAAFHCALCLSSLIAGCTGDLGSSDDNQLAAPLTMSGVTATLSLQNDWGTGYCANVTLTNSGASNVTAWTVVVALNQSSLSQSWSATVSQGTGQFTATPLSWNATISPGGSTSFGFCGNATGSSYRPALLSLSVVGGGGSSGSGGTSAGSGGRIGSGGSGSGGSGSGGSGSGGAGSGGAGSGGSSATCAALPVSPNATQQAKNLLCYLYSQYGNHVLSGQQETSWSNPAGDINWYISNGMKYPAILGGDFMYRDSSSCTSVTSTTTRAIAYWNAGGIPMIRYHMGMPGSGLTCANDCYQGANCAMPTNGSPSAAFFTNVITPGTPENASLRAKLDYVAVQIAAMKAANVPVILAIFHETQANGWFWWSMTSSGTAFANLWKYAFNYLTSTKGLNNIVWLMPFSGSVSSAFYPGKTYVDISGPDTYATNQPFTSTYSAARSVLGTTLPIPLHETGLIPTPNAMFPSAAPWVLFNVWAGYQSDGTHNTVANIRNVYADPHTVTRDEIPSLK